MDEATVGDRVREQAGALADQLAIGILQTDPSGNCVALNPHGARVLGLSEAEALGDGWLAPLGTEARSALLRRWHTSAAEAGPASMDVLLRDAHGDPRTLSCRVVPLRGPDGFVSGYLAALLDVTEWKRTEQDLRKTTRNLASRLRELDCLFEVSRAVERSAGDLAAILRETADILGRTWSHPGPACARISLEGQSYQTSNYVRCTRVRRSPIFLHGEAAGEIEIGDPGNDALDDPGPSSREEERLLEAVAQRLGRTAEREQGRRLLQEKEEEMRARLTHLTRVSTMGEMASSIAHEVNQPLTAIATYAQACSRLVESGEADFPEVVEVLGRISSEALRAGNIVHRLKDMVRRQEARWRECDVNSLIQDLEQLASVDARLHNVSLRFELAPDLPPVLADGVQVQQVILNLIRNGIDAVDEASPSAGEVVVRTGLAGSRAIGVSVEDDGCGVPEALAARLFEPFFTTKKGGMGMGLSISRSIAASHRGRISFERNPGRGVTFHFHIPTIDDA